MEIYLWVSLVMFTWLAVLWAPSSLRDFLIKWALAASVVAGGVLLMKHLGYIIKI
jgi:hypothetical protein